MTKTPAWRKPLRWWAPWRSWAVRREWDRQVRCMAEAGYRRTGWATWEDPGSGAAGSARATVCSPESWLAMGGPKAA